MVSRQIDNFYKKMVKDNEIRSKVEIFRLSYLLSLSQPGMCIHEMPFRQIVCTTANTPYNSYNEHEMKPNSWSIRDTISMYVAFINCPGFQTLLFYSCKQICYEARYSIFLTICDKIELNLKIREIVI